MVLRTRKHVKEQITEQDEIEINFNPPTINKKEYELPSAYRPIYDSLPDVMDVLHLPHITIKNPTTGATLKALYKLNLLKRLESSTYSFVKSIQTLYESESQLLEFLNQFKNQVKIDEFRSIEGEEVSGSQFLEDKKSMRDLEETLEEFGFDTGALKSEDGVDELSEDTVGDVTKYIREDLTILTYFLSKFIADISKNANKVRDNSVEVRQWLEDKEVNKIPEISQDKINPEIYPGKDLSDVIEETEEFYKSVFELKEFRDPKIDELIDVYNKEEGKVLIFTQYRATADYVYRTLLQNEESPLNGNNSELVKGGDEYKQDIIRRFAPEAYGYKDKLKQEGLNEIKYVVATDTLSEGVNLQDVTTVVNYDLPWNPMKIVQRVGRIDRIGNTDEKHVYNFFPDGDIEAAIKLLKRLQAKISDIALIVGKENNILDPEENKVLDEAGVQTQKTIGELEIDEIEGSLRKTRQVGDYNNLDDTTKNPLLRDAGSDEQAAFERLLLKKQINEEYNLKTEDFDYAKEYFETLPKNRDQLYTRIDWKEGRPQNRQKHLLRTILRRTPRPKTYQKPKHKTRNHRRKTQKRQTKSHRNKTKNRKRIR